MGRDVAHERKAKNGLRYKVASATTLKGTGPVSFLGCVVNVAAQFVLFRTGKEIFILQKNNTNRLLVMALLIAMEIVLTRFMSVNTPILRIGFGFLPISMIAILYGPWPAGIAYAVGDVLGALMFPTAPPFPGFTLSALLTGLIFGKFLYEKQITWKRVLVPSILIAVFIDLILNTYWLTLLTGKGFMFLLPTRIAKAVVMPQIQMILIPLVYNRILSKIPIRDFKREKQLA